MYLLVVAAGYLPACLPICWRVLYSRHFLEARTVHGSYLHAYHQPTLGSCCCGCCCGHLPTLLVDKNCCYMDACRAPSSPCMYLCVCLDCSTLRGPVALTVRTHMRCCARADQTCRTGRGGKPRCRCHPRLIRPRTPGPITRRNRITAAAGSEAAVCPPHGVATRRGRPAWRSSAPVSYCALMLLLRTCNCKLPFSNSGSPTPTCQAPRATMYACARLVRLVLRAEIQTQRLRIVRRAREPCRHVRPSSPHAAARPSRASGGPSHVRAAVGQPEQPAPVSAVHACRYIDT